VSGPLISVIIPAYNRSHYLREAIDSVLGQRHVGGDVEIVVVDDGSTDGTADVARDYHGVVCHRQPNQGTSAARNAGVTVSRGTVLAFLDSDDIALPDRLSVQFAALQQPDPPDLVFGMVQEFLSPEVQDELAGTRVIAEEPVLGRVPGAMLLRREVFERIGPWDPEIPVRESIEWIARARALGATDHVVPEVVLRRRHHLGNLGLQERQDQPFLPRALKRVLDLRRSIEAQGEGSGATGD
jgi:glycosyltransferase involved in cell wall biosynthesis